jgi:hypothetical protein
LLDANIITTELRKFHSLVGNIIII